MTVTYPSNVWSFDPISCLDDEDPSLAIILSLHESRDLDGIYIKLQEECLRFESYQSFRWEPILTV